MHGIGGALGCRTVASSRRPSTSGRVPGTPPPADLRTRGASRFCQPPHIQLPPVGARIPERRRLGWDIGRSRRFRRQVSGRTSGSPSATKSADSRGSHFAPPPATRHQSKGGVTPCWQVQHPSGDRRQRTPEGATGPSGTPETLHKSIKPHGAGSNLSTTPLRGFPLWAILFFGASPPR